MASRIKSYPDLGIFALIVIIAVGGYIYWNSAQKNQTSQYQPVSSQLTSTQEKMAINDDSLGLAFLVDKQMQRMSQAITASLNPSIVYGFSIPLHPEVKCLISQAKQLNNGTVSAEYLRDGTFNQVKSANPDAVLNSWSKQVIEGGIQTVSLDIKYTDNKIATRQVELVGTNDTRTTFAYCVSPDTDYPTYKQSFADFLDSIRIK